MNWIKCVAIICATVIVSNDASAQLLKKLKEKAEKAIDGKGKNSGSNSSAGSNDDSNTSSASSNASSPGSSSKTTAKDPAGPPANGSVVFNLGVDEQFLYDETAITSNNNGVSYQFVVRSKAGYFLIDNGNRTGPFKTAPIKSRNVPVESDAESNDVSIGDKKDDIAIQYTKTIGGKLFIVFNGKNYGPYNYVSKMLVSPDQKKFFAVTTIGGANNMTTKMGMGNTHIVSNTGVNQKVGSSSTIPLKFFVSESFTQAMVVVMDQNSQQLFTATTAGKQTESTMADMYSSGEGKLLVSDKGDIISIPSQSPRQILVNGSEAASFKVPIESISRLTITPDVSKSVYYNNGKLYKANGDEVSISGILFPKIITTGNTTMVYYFKVYKNETGVKDVYLCKKEI